jgi:hypothetical protein
MPKGPSVRYLIEGSKRTGISLVMNEAAKAQREAEEGPLEYSHPSIVSGPAGATNRFDPMGNDIRVSTPPTVEGANNWPIGEDAQVDGGLNPAQNDYPEGRIHDAASVSSRPPNAKSDFNPDLDKRSYNADYREDVARENEVESQKQMENAPLLSEDSPADPKTADYDAERAAKEGVTTTTIEDAASAAKKGVVIGLGVGAFAAVAALALPGFGLVLGGGALATALAGVAASTAGGAMASGVVGYLKDQGVPAPHIPRYQSAYEGGGALVSVELADPDRQSEIEDVLTKYGATDVERYGDQD